MIARPGGQCDRHYEIEAWIGEIRGIVVGTDAKIDAVTERLDRLMLHFVPQARTGNGITVQNTASNAPAAPASQSDGLPWQRLLLLLASIAVMLATLASGAITTKIETKPATVEAPSVPPR